MHVTSWGDIMGVQRPNFCRRLDSDEKRNSIRFTGKIKKEKFIFVFSGNAIQSNVLKKVSVDFKTHVRIDACTQLDTNFLGQPVSPSVNPSISSCVLAYL